MRQLADATDDAIVTGALLAIVKPRHPILFFYYWSKKMSTFTQSSSGKISILYCVLHNQLYKAAFISTVNQYL